MKFLAVFAIIALASASSLSADNTAAEWEAWKFAHNKIYASEEEEAIRFQNYVNNIEYFAKMNDLDEGAEFGVGGPFSDLTFEEFEQFYTMPEFDLRWREDLPKYEPKISANDIPDSYDLREIGGIGPIKNQGQCGSCWAFGTLNTVESAAFTAGHEEYVALSEQFLVDCDTEKDGGCRGGLPWYAYDFIIEEGGVPAEADYPYTAKDETCKADPETYVYQIEQWSQVGEDEDVEIRAAMMEYGSISIGIHAGSGMMGYKGGVWSAKLCGKQLNHAVNIVGWGEDGGKPFWLIRNSWGSSWGEDGYMRIARGSGRCGLNKACTVVSVAPPADPEN